MEYKFCGGSIELLSETITNLLWYLWNLYCKEQEISLFWLIYNEGKLKVDIINTGYSHSFELETSYNGTIIITKNDSSTNMVFHKDIYLLPYVEPV